MKLLTLEERGREVLANLEAQRVANAAAAANLRERIREILVAAAMPDTLSAERIRRTLEQQRRGDVPKLRAVQRHLAAVRAEITRHVATCRGDSETPGGYDSAL